MSNLTNPPKFSASVTPSDVTDLAVPSMGIWVGVTGNISVQMYGAGNTQIFTNVPVGYFSVQCTRVNATGTTATGLVAVWS